jgi:hypothetical protein
LTECRDEQTGDSQGTHPPLVRCHDRLRNCTVCQTNLGNALYALGARESGTARLEEAVAAHRDALKEKTRERVPLQWAPTARGPGRNMVVRVVMGPPKMPSSNSMNHGKCGIKVAKVHGDRRCDDKNDEG